MDLVLIALEKLLAESQSPEQLRDYLEKCKLYMLKLYNEKTKYITTTAASLETLAEYISYRTARLATLNIEDNNEKKELDSIQPSETPNLRRYQENIAESIRRSRAMMAAERVTLETEIACANNEKFQLNSHIAHSLPAYEQAESQALSLVKQAEEKLNQQLVAATATAGAAAPALVHQFAAAQAASPAPSDNTAAAPAASAAKPSSS